MPIVKPKRTIGRFFSDYGDPIVVTTVITGVVTAFGFAIKADFDNRSERIETARQRDAEYLRVEQEREQLLLQAFENKTDTVTFSDGSIFGVVVTRNLSGDFFVAAHKPSEISSEGKIISMTGEAFMRLKVPAPK